MNKRPHIKDYFTRQFIMFFLCSTFAAGVNFGSRILFNIVVSFEVSVVFAYGCGFFTAFVLNKMFVFDEKQGRTRQQLFGFAVVNVFAFVQTMGFSIFFRSMVFPAIGFILFADEIAHLIGVGVPMFTSFLGHKYFSFRR